MCKCIFIFPATKKSEFQFPLSCLPMEFIAEHVRICKEFTDRQLDTITQNLDHYPSVCEQYMRWIDSVKDACADLYISTCGLRPIPNYSRLIPYKKVQYLSSKNKFV